MQELQKYKMPFSMRTHTLQVEIPAKDLEIAALQRPYVVYLANEGKINSIAIIAKSNEAAEYP